ncbi:MAG TPA: UvrD-helicase domain-containing protein, partial [Casimicrobiaceae bacterium]|nr:UvrD-helicase domain-containing protein [Casimicrobiaceae bacterium]
MNDLSSLASQDAAARDNALDVTGSWLVQAPAGSGKTSLLIQRFLALLAIVDRPERIVAMTFTRKAAAEMRTRIIDALRAAAQAADDAQLPAHEARTRELARRALANDVANGWRLLEQPARLRIMTIDALAASIARQAPLSAGLGALPRFVDDASALYREAARAAIAEARVDDAHWRTFLAWQDNDAEAATRLLAQMLAERDRWPLRIFDENVDALRCEVEALLAREARDAIAIVAGLLPRALADALPGHAQAATEGFRENDGSPDCLPGLEALCHDGALPALDDRRSWCALGDWLLTGAGTFLQQVTKRQGFLAAGAGTGRQERVRRKADFEDWLREAASIEGLAHAWHRLRELPPERFEDDAWGFVVAAMRVLSHAAGALERVFRAHGEADFAEATLRALAALGPPDEPSDALLAIDYRLSHLLIDEFQDTSNAQLALIARLIEGWTPEDGRTLFAVGDPMQSIYRFREADVAQFLEAQARAQIAGVRVGVVELTRNFRSQPEIVGWVNAVFRSVLPAVSDPSRGEAAYRPAYADAARNADLAPTLDLVTSRGAEADAVVQRIREAQSAGIDDIAVLVRARSHAQPLLPALRRAGIHYSAVDLEGLHDRLATRDLLALARAISQPNDRLAWLSMLRAPWCGLTLADLLVVAGASSRTIAEAIVLDDVLNALPHCARTRLTRFSHA